MKKIYVAPTSYSGIINMENVLVSCSNTEADTLHDSEIMSRESNGGSSGNSFWDEEN